MIEKKNQLVLCWRYHGWSEFPIYLKVPVISERHPISLRKFLWSDMQVGEEMGVCAARLVLPHSHHLGSFADIRALEVLWEHGKGRNQLDPISCTSLCSNSCLMEEKYALNIPTSVPHLNGREFHSASSVNSLPFTSLSSYNFPTRNLLNLLFHPISSTTLISFGLAMLWHFIWGTSFSSSAPTGWDINTDIGQSPKGVPRITKTSNSCKIMVL